MKAIDIAKLLLKLQNFDSLDITNLKLQKLLYFAQGLSLAIYNKPLFEEAIEAWSYGPVVPEVYREFKEYGKTPIPLPTDDYSHINDSELMNILNLTLQEFNQYSAWKLAEITHSEGPWKDYYKPNTLASTIPVDSIKNYFATLVEDE